MATDVIKTPDMIVSRRESKLQNTLQNLKVGKGLSPIPEVSESLPYVRRTRRYAPWSARLDGTPDCLVRRTIRTRRSAGLPPDYTVRRTRRYVWWPRGALPHFGPRCVRRRPPLLASGLILATSASDVGPHFSDVGPHC